MKTSIVLLFLLALASQASARIGETLEQCVTRYGKAVESGGRSAAFKNGGYSITVSFEHKKAVILHYTKEKKNSSGDNAQLSDADIAAILKTNGGEQAWEKVERSMPQDGWRTKDRKMFAEYLFSGMLVVSAPEWTAPSLRK